MLKSSLCRSGSVVEHVLGKNEVTGPIPVFGSRCDIIPPMAKRGNRITIGFQCSVCKSRNHLASKNTVNLKEKLALNKFCKECRKTTKHTEYTKLK